MRRTASERAPPRHPGGARVAGSIRVGQGADGPNFAASHLGSRMLPTIKESGTGRALHGRHVNVI
ncbi:hypothetical protein GCM10010199_69840 [Dactylosporangium roseum]